ncbi:GM24277 [Drosophila sechellia]|uniref:GM24277 n=1 Tax=Drosophila sechellia TaxID=7238 RepID=B4HLF1_DROSE|nr:GM24277 [Drosophila sechellia]
MGDMDDDDDDDGPSLSLYLPRLFRRRRLDWRKIEDAALIEEEKEAGNAKMKPEKSSRWELQQSHLLRIFLCRSLSPELQTLPLPLALPLPQPHSTPPGTPGPSHLHRIRECKLGEMSWERVLWGSETWRQRKR